MKNGNRVSLAFVALAALLPFGTTAPHAASTIIPDASAAVGFATAFDRTIEQIIQFRVATEKLSQADARVAREQLQFQFLSLTQAEQQRVLAAVHSNNGLQGAAAAMQALNSAVTDAARQALADVNAAAKAVSPGMQPKLGSAGPDLVFVNTAGPCRIADSRNGPGQLPAGSARQLYTMDSGVGYPWGLDQGGTGTAGAGNCVGTTFTLPYPDSVVAIVTAVNTTSTGALQAWNGGTTLSGGAVVVWSPGDRATNTTVIPMNRAIAAYPGSGFKRDIALNNNSVTPVDYVVDVVGYFIENTATALQCTIVNSATTVAPPNAWTPIDATCPAGYSATGGGFNTVEGTLGYPGVWTTNLPVNSTTWRTWVDNQTGGNRSIYTSVQCCRVPGR
jgi:hypothetical protein